MLGFSAPPRPMQTGSGVLPVIPLRTVVTNNRVLTGSEARSETAVYSRWQYIIASAADQLCVSNNGWKLEQGGEQNNANDFTIVDQSIEIGGVVVPVTYSGGRSILVAAGAVDIKSDMLSPSAFGLSEFAYGTQVYMKTKISLASSGLAVPYTAETIQSGLGQQAAWYNTANTAVSSTDTAGSYTYTGTAPAARTAAYRPMILGRPLVDGTSFVTVGDSIAMNFNDSGSPYQVHGGGYVQRSMRSSINTDFLPNLNLARSASPPSAIIGTNTKTRQFYKYARYAIDEYGTNNMNTGAMRTDLQTIWSQLRTEGVQKIVRMKFLPRTTSTDSWTTEANQTYRNDGNWQNGAAADLNNQWFDTLIAGGTLDVVVDAANATAYADGGDRWKWRVNGTANYSNADDTHPNSTGHELVAITLRPVLRSL